ncbi:MAG: SPOR domain-containing protein [Pseudomonadota bacterium]
MPPDLPNEQELNLKKRARRRLVGAVALVLLMVIVLPRVLQDRAALAPQESIKITMPAVDGQDVVVNRDSIVVPKVDHDQISELVAKQEPVTQMPVINESSKVEAVHNQVVDVDAKSDDQHVSDFKQSSTENKISDSEKPITKAEKKIDVKNVPEAIKSKTVEVKVKEIKPEEPKINKPKVVEPKVSEPKVVETKASQKKSNGFSVQVGVYSDANNVQQLQGKLKEIGYSSHTEKVSTPKGEKIRLKAGSFPTRQDAVQAQAKIQKIGLSGMVVSND